LYPHTVTAYGISRAYVALTVIGPARAGSSVGTTLVLALACVEALLAAPDRSIAATEPQALASKLTWS